MFIFFCGNSIASSQTRNVLDSHVSRVHRRLLKDAASGVYARVSSASLIGLEEEVCKRSLYPLAKF